VVSYNENFSVLLLDSSEENEINIRGYAMRLVIVSNRLQVTVTENDGDLSFTPSSGGLATGIGAYLETLTDFEYIWVGWPGSARYSDNEAVKNELSQRYHCRPVFVDESSMDRFYNGFCNKTLWPLFHYFPYLTIYDEKMWNNYEEVNALFADELAKIVQPGDIVWIHDYHFMLLPRLIREKCSECSIGFFLHIPFPSYEIFRLLPRKWGKEILEGLLQADLIGFHTYEYTQYFLRCVLRILGFSHDMGMLTLTDKLTFAGTFPMGIDFEKYNAAVNLDSVKKERNTIKKDLQHVKVIFSVDRQDYTKGILNRLEGYDLFLKKNPEWRGKVMLLMIVAPSRIGVEDYERAKYVINQLIGRINGEYGSINWTPVVYQYKAVSFEHLVALYNVSDIGLVTPLRDGMNLVAKEYIAAQKEKRGVLILSEMAGAAMELGEAIVINPNNREEIAEAIKTALDMKPDEQARRITAMQERIKKYDVKRWADDFLKDLDRATIKQARYHTKLLEGEKLDELFDRFREAEKRILFLDYDGTLVPIANKPQAAAPDKKIINLLRRISKQPGIDLVIISGRKKEDLFEWFGKFKITLIGEHGVWIRRPKGKWRLVRQLRNDWKPLVIRILEKYKDRLPGSFIEDKDYSVAWHFRDSESTMAELRAKEFVDDMMQFTAAKEIEILLGKKVVELKCSGVSKGDAAIDLLAEGEYDFILAAGDDDTDEALFQALPAGSFTIKIGKQKSFADFSLASSAAFVEFLELFVERKRGLLESIIDIVKRFGK
jgi:trehalose 6-phosphate synthase/phosphatase